MNVREKRLIVVAMFLVLCDLTQAKGLCQFAEMFQLQDVENCFSSTKVLDPVASISCPSIMLVRNCTCQKTCQDPTGLLHCHKNCTNSKTCICPVGLYLQGNECVTLEKCGCYIENERLIQDGTKIVNCTTSCTCINGELSCHDYSCDINAECEERNNRLQCYCREGYHGNGIYCNRSTNCKNLYDAGFTEDGVYPIYPLQWTGSPFDVYCRKGWTVFQRRRDGSVDFYRNWTSYKEGFGNVEGEMWLGNEKLFYLTSQDANELKIYVTFDDNSSYWLSYDVFGIGNETTNFKLDNLGSFTGNTGFDYMEFHKYQQFTTFDRDNDAQSSQNCAVHHRGAWWYNKCFASNLNGIYGNDWDTGVCLYNRVDFGKKCKVRFTEMSIRPVQNQTYPDVAIL